MNLTLFKQDWRGTWKPLAVFLAVCAMYIAVIVAMFDPELGELMNQMAAAMPDLFAAFGMGAAAATLLDFLLNYLYGFLLLVLPMVFLLMAANRVVVKHVDSGAMACLLSAGVTRARMIATQIAGLLTGLLALDLGCLVLGAGCAELMFPGELAIGDFLLANAGLFCLHLCMAGLCFFFSCVFNDSRRAMSVSAGVLVVEYLIQMVVNMGDKFSGLKYATFFTLYDPYAAAAGEGAAWLGCLILGAAGAVLLAAGAAIFCRRDLPL